MEIDEVVARIGRRYWPLLGLAMIISILAVNAHLDRQPDLQTATTRLTVVIRGTETMAPAEAASLTVSQVKATATGSGLLGRATTAANVRRDTGELASRIDVRGLGTSRTVELNVSDPRPAIARSLANAIANEVVGELNGTLNSGPQAVLSRIDEQLAELTGKAEPLRAKVRDRPGDSYSAGRLASIENQIDDLRSQRQTTLEQMAEFGQSSVVQRAEDADSDNGRASMLVLAALAGLIIGILLATLAEAIRPTVPGARRVARRLGVPLLGNADGSVDELAEMGQRIRLAARKAGVSKIALVGTGSSAVPAELVSRVTSEVYGDQAGVVATETMHNDNGTGGPPRETKQEPKPMATGSTAMVARRTPKPVPKPAMACHVHVLTDIEPSTESVSLVVVAGPVTPVSALRSVTDLTEASGWPLLGVIAVNGRS